jgi:hypothetical protein
MSRIKDAITDVTFTLIDVSTITVQNPKLPSIPKTREESVYTYAGDNGAKLTFQAHPTLAMEQVIIAGDALGRLAAPLVIEAFIEAAMNSSGRWLDRVRTLKI